MHVTRENEGATKQNLLRLDLISVEKTLCETENENGMDMRKET